MTAKRAAAGNLSFEALADRGRAASERNDADRYAAEQARMLEVLTRPVPVVKAPGMPEPPADACLEHMDSRMIEGSDGLLVGTSCACSMQRMTIAGRVVRVVISRRG